MIIVSGALSRQVTNRPSRRAIANASVVLFSSDVT